MQVVTRASSELKKATPPQDEEKHFRTWQLPHHVPSKRRQQTHFHSIKKEYEKQKQILKEKKI
jgi:hypothetical protein